MGLIFCISISKFIFNWLYLHEKSILYIMDRYIIIGNWIIQKKWEIESCTKSTLHKMRGWSIIMHKIWGHKYHVHNRCTTRTWINIRQIIQKVFEFCNIIIMVAFEWDIISVAGFAYMQCTWSYMPVLISITFGYLSKVFVGQGY